MIKEFEIKDILNAVNTISKAMKKDKKIDNKKTSYHKNDTPIRNNQAKFEKRDILVLDEMIE